jgi:hypothetical protein
MSKRLNKNVLVIIFLVLVIIVAVVWFLDNKNGERSFRSELFDFEPASVTALSIFPPSPSDQEIRLEQEGDDWFVMFGEERYPADTANISRLLLTVLQSKPERVAGLDKSSWEGFRITDSTGTRVIVEEDGEIVTELTTGRVSFSQPPQSQAYGRNQNPIIKSHVRVADDDKVYLVDGYLSLMFNNNPAMYRDKNICRFDESQPSELVFTYPGDSSFILSKTAGNWSLGNQTADSAEMVSYIRALSTTTGTEFAGKDEISVLNFPYRLKISGNDLPDIVIEGYKDDIAEHYYIKSSENPTAVFRNNNSGLFEKIFVSKEKFK